MEDVESPHHGSAFAHDADHGSHQACSSDSQDPGMPSNASLSQLGSFIAAGVLPYCIDNEGNVKFFLGKELAKGPNLAGKNKYSWSDFGGKRENEAETAQETACREFSEETLGMWGGMGHLKQRVQQSIQNLQRRIDRACALNRAEIAGPVLDGASGEEVSQVFVLKNGLYINYVVRLPYIDPLLFQLARDENDSLLAGELPDSDICRAAEKRDWAWVDSKLLLACVEGGICRALDQDGQRIHLLPRLAVTLRSHLSLILNHINCEGGCHICSRLLVVPMQQECRCLHLFDIRAVLSSDEVRAAFGEGSMIERVTIYRDRNGKSNVFVLFCTGQAAIAAKARAIGPEMDERLWGCAQEEAGSQRAQFAWFEYGGGDGPVRPRGTVAAKRRVARRRKLGVGLPTAPWAKRRGGAASAGR